jgi:hypothetical protein
MRYASASAFRSALEQRLRNRAEQSGVPLVRLRKAIVFDRFLARILANGTDQWVVKGALALDFRLGDVTRTTKDIDLVHRQGIETAEQALIDAQRLEADDFFEISLERVAQLGDQAGNAVRYRARAELAGRLFDEVLVDIGMSEILVGEPEVLPGSDLLEFADIPALEVPTLPLEQHIAEKVHAYTRTYGQGLASTRAKDLVDLVLIAANTSPRADRLAKALKAVFEIRALQAVPDSLPRPPADWTLQYRRMAGEVGIVTDLGDAHRQASEMLDPVLSGDAVRRWKTDQQRWDR